MYSTEFNLVRDFNNKDAMNECEYNINELYSFQSNDYVFKPFKHYSEKAKSLAESLLEYRDLRQDGSDLVNATLAMSIFCDNLYRVFYNEFNIHQDGNIHNYSVKRFQSLCKAQGVEFSRVYWEGNLLSFCWETRVPVYLPDVEQLVQTLQEFLGFIDSLGIEGFFFEEMYSDIRVFKGENLRFDKHLFDTYDDKNHHQEQELTNSSYGLLQEDGTMKCYDVNGNPITYDEACDFD